MHSWEEGVEDTLSSQEWGLAGEFLSHGSWVTHGPHMGHLDINLLSVWLLDDHDGIGAIVVALWEDLDDSSVQLG